MVQTSKQRQNNSTTPADRVSVVYYTDPLCCWSWAMEEAWEKFIDTHRDRLQIRYCMGGLLPDWNSYYDEVNSINRPVQMGPLWMEVRHRTGASLQDRIWITDPPASSYPACIAVKAAGIQGEHYQELMLRQLRICLMLEGKNIAKTSVLQEAAVRLGNNFSSETFREHLLGDAGRNRFREDLNDVKLHQVTRFPTIRMTRNGRSILITGYRKYEVLQSAFRKLTE